MTDSKNNIIVTIREFKRDNFFLIVLQVYSIKYTPILLLVVVVVVVVVVDVIIIIITIIISF